MSTAPCATAVENADQRITAIALEHPQRPALIAAGQRITFEEFDAKTNDVVRALLDQGIGRGDVVAVCFTSRIEVAWVLRGILRLGAMFVPIEPDHPQERVEYLLKDASPRLLITTEALASLFHFVRITVLTVEAIYASDCSWPCREPGLDDPACILYTSGSTGHPKGVLRLHRGIVSRLAWVDRESDDIFCHCMSLCYGFSQERLLLPSMLGLPLVFLSDECQKDATRFAQEVEQFQITRITVVPAILEQLLDERRQLYKHLSRVRTVTSGSAFLPQEVIERFSRLLPDSRLINVYGSTESGTITVGNMTVSSEANVGTPAPGMVVFVLNEHLEPVPNGEVGDIYGGGPGLAQGYWRNEALTAERFVGNPFSTGSSRLYKTGDRGRILPSGALQLTGRADRQVKVRGHRVELAEVEAAILQIAGIREAVVVGHETGYDTRLIAYLCPAAEHHVSVSSVRRHLNAQVPNYMLPSAYIFLTALPRTAIGKVDSAGLPNPELSRVGLENPYVQPYTAIEQTIADTWGEILELGCVGRDDHFLDLGGDSINAVEIAAALEARLGIHVDSVSCFELPTVADMAVWIEERKQYFVDRRTEA